MVKEKALYKKGTKTKTNSSNSKTSLGNECDFAAQKH
jgi:hypothetical protein